MVATRKSGLAGHTKSVPVTSHTGQWEILLIRAGHHLWREYKQARKSGSIKEMCVLDLALQSAWGAKELYLVPFRLAAMAERQAKSERMKKRRGEHSGFRAGKGGSE